MSLMEKLPWKRLKWACFWGFVVLLVATYVADWWSLRVEKQTVEGKTSYQVQARIHMGNAPQKFDSHQSYGEIDGGNTDDKDLKEKKQKYINSVSQLFNGKDQSGKGNDEGKAKVDPTLASVTKSDKAKTDKGFTGKGIQESPLLSTKGSKMLSDSPTKGLPEVTGSRVVTPRPAVTSRKYFHPRLIPNIKVKGADCARIVSNDRNAMNSAKEHQSANPKVLIPDQEYLNNASQSCENFISQRQYVTKPINQEEEEFPIAFSLLLYKEVELAERLLRAIYRPQNYYCIHVDKKSPPVIHQAMAAIASCFDNVFISSRSVDVQWAWFSVLEPELVCMEDLWKYKKWKYFINLTGQEFPLKTNWDLVKILKAFNGANNLEGTVKRRNNGRTEWVHQGFTSTQKRKPPPPVNITLAKGSVHIAAQRGFVDYMLHDERALAFRDWVKDTGVPDETFFASLNLSPQLGVPGSNTGDPETNKDTNTFMTRYKNWGTWPFDFPCAGFRERMICIEGVGDVPRLASRPEMFVNKFHSDYHPLAYDCMEQLHFNRTREEAMGQSYFDDSYYKQLEFVKHHLA